MPPLGRSRSVNGAKSDPVRMLIFWRVAAVPGTGVNGVMAARATTGSATGRPPSSPLGIPSMQVSDSF